MNSTPQTLSAKLQQMAGALDAGGAVADIAGELVATCAVALGEIAGNAVQVAARFTVDSAGIWTNPASVKTLGKLLGIERDVMKCIKKRCDVAAVNRQTWTVRLDNVDADELWIASRLRPLLPPNSYELIRTRADSTGTALPAPKAHGKIRA